MEIGYPDLLGIWNIGSVQWSERDVMLYALAIGMGSDPLDPGILDFVYERELKVMPSFVAALSIDSGAWSRLGLDMQQVLHGAHAVTLYGDVPTSGRCETRSRITQAWDQGPDKAAILIQEMELFLDADGGRLATIATTIFARGDGGFGGPAGRPERHRLPDRAPDAVREYATLPQQALLYRLTGDYNPLHADPQVARAGGFEVPILHGMCSYGISCRAMLEAWCDNDPARMSHHEARFSAPVYPGETLVVETWRTDDGVAFRLRAKERGVVVVDNGRTLLRAPGAVKR
ncbi:MAG: MaoC/PaaZ C-terminal domain-containing protein [Sphingomonadaceae bacterium]